MTSERLSYTVVREAGPAYGGRTLAESRDAFRRVMDALQRVLPLMDADDLGELARRLDDAAAPPPRTAASKFARELAGTDFTPAERVRLEIEALVGTFEHRRELLRDTLGTDEVARLLGTSRQTPHDRAKARTLLAVQDRGQLRFPLWQFDPEGPNGVVEGLPAVMKELRVGPESALRWLVAANPYLDGRTPLEALRSGELDDVLDLARAVESD